MLVQIAPQRESRPAPPLDPNGNAQSPVDRENTHDVTAECSDHELDLKAAEVCHRFWCSTRSKLLLVCGNKTRLCGR